MKSFLRANSTTGTTMMTKRQPSQASLITWKVALQVGLINQRHLRRPLLLLCQSHPKFMQTDLWSETVSATYSQHSTWAEKVRCKATNRFDLMALVTIKMHSLSSQPNMTIYRSSNLRWTEWTIRTISRYALSLTTIYLLILSTINLIQLYCASSRDSTRTITFQSTHLTFWYLRTSANC